MMHSAALYLLKDTRHLFSTLMVPLMFPVKLNGNEMGQSISSEKIGKYIRAVFI